MRDHRHAQPNAQRGAKVISNPPPPDPAVPDVGPPARSDQDIYRLAPSMDATVLGVIADRLEFRGADLGYARLSQAYLTRLPLLDARRVLALGCGTGVEVRALRGLTESQTTIVGIDHSPELIDAARRITANAGLSDNVTYETANAHELPYGVDEFDIVTLHTLISHVDDPLEVLREAHRVIRPGGMNIPSPPYL